MSLKILKKYLFTCIYRKEPYFRESIYFTDQFSQKYWNRWKFAVNTVYIGKQICIQGKSLTQTSPIEIICLGKLLYLIIRQDIIISNKITDMFCEISQIKQDSGRGSQNYVCVGTEIWKLTTQHPNLPTQWPIFNNSDHFHRQCNSYL